MTKHTGHEVIHLFLAIDGSHVLRNNPAKKHIIFQWDIIPISLYYLIHELAINDPLIW